MKKRHEELTQQLNEGHINEMMKYVLSKIMQDYPCKGEKIPAIHFRVFYQVQVTSHQSPANLLNETLKAFKESTKSANIGFTVIPACSLQNFGTFISISGIRHE